MIPLRDNLKSQSTPYVNISIISICVMVFIAQFATADGLMRWAFVPRHLVSPAAWSEYGVGTILLSGITAMFMHGGLLHLLFNMLFLWVFGDNVEDRFGHGRYLVFYLVCGVIASLAHSVVTLFAEVPMVGASGAIAGVMGAYFVMFKYAKIRALVPIFIIFTVVDLPAVLFIGIWFVFQLLSAIGTIGGATGIAFMAHVGGFLAGYLMARPVVRRRRPPPPRVVDLRIE